MRIASSLAVAAALFVAAPVMAQTPPPAAAEAPISPEEAALNVKAQAFSARMQQLGTELEAAITTGAGDQTKTMADVDVVLGRYRPEVNTFADDVATFLNGESAKSTDPEEKAGLAQAATSASASIRGIPDQARAGILERLTNPPAPAAPAAPQ
ncbi:hypothetical protein ASG17_03345 [Brevundimonas sp. Leaf363]|uniref:hypothetical protein n=1 Tax=Brevundimonas sp. Leaf363 TaxID=1736353 RepID=UPI0006FA3EF9|nr:hypothetical protein [Brevundimonas sp. Leaf363]KQS55144.1 hypothetical protein ASG17_03345 [Brevundimonas sp. Leaf363]